MQQKVRRRIFLTSGISVAGMLVAGGGADIYAHQIEPAWLEITRQTLSLPHLEPGFENYRIVQISDIHSDLMWMDQTRLEHIVQQVNDQKPDVIVITGDFVSGTINERKLAVLSSLRFLKARDGVLAVLGNHDYQGQTKWLRKMLHIWGIHELRDSSYTLRRGNSMLHFVGMDDLWPHSGPITSVWSHKERLVNILKHLPASGAVILLVHEPDFADVAASTKRVDLQLSGHTHGGQVCLPLYGPLLLPPLGELYPSGLYHLDTMLHYTNRGVGMMSPLVRFNCRPEISVFTCQTI